MTGLLATARDLWASVFVRCAALLVVTTGAVAGTLVVLSLQGALRIADEGVRTRAAEATRFAAEQAGGALAFGKTAALDDLLTQLQETTNGAATGALALRSGGRLAAATPGAGEGALAALAERAAESGTTERSADGFALAMPVRFGKDNAVIGAVASQWTAQPARTRIFTETAMALAAAGVIFLAALALSMWILRRTVTRPLLEVGAAMERVAGGDHGGAIPGTARHDEIGRLARILARFRDAMRQGAETRREAAYKGAGFESSSAALGMADTSGRLIYGNAAFQAFLESRRKTLSEAGRGLPQPVIGSDMDVFGAIPARLREALRDPARLPLTAEAEIAGMTLAVEVNAIRDAAGDWIGYVVEWQDVTEIRHTGAVLGALDSSQCKAEFDPGGRLVSANDNFCRALDRSAAELARSAPGTLLSMDEPGWSAAECFRNHRSAAGRFRLPRADGGSVALDGSLTPVKNRAGQAVRFVLIGADVTASEAVAAAAETARKRLEAAQAQVVDALRAGLSRLSRGDLTVVIPTAFAEDYEQLRADFNEAAGQLRGALEQVSRNAGSISSEARNISGAADDLSQRTETQAATLEQTVAALGKITASMKEANEGVRRANTVVAAARAKAEESGGVVRDAVSAMGEIETSSDQISKIIQVIDDIAFQTNLLALNAGVEAARAGEAGRGFAVVASEVRALAQRSSEAAREINGLISASGTHVQRGVTLVGEAGEALAQLVRSVSDISQHVDGIESSAEEQSTSLDEINTAMQALDRVTQENAAMFEETTAASHSLTREAETLTQTMTRFRIEPEGATPAAPDLSPAIAPSIPPPSPPRRAAAAGGAHAEATGWEDF